MPGQFDTPEIKKQERSSLSAAAESLETSMQQENLREFLQRIEKLPPKERRDIFAKTLKWNQSGVYSDMRRAGLTEGEDEFDSLKKHVLLASVFLERDIQHPSKLVFKINFAGNDLAERKVGLGDILPVNVKAVKVYEVNGSIACARAFRGINPDTGRIGYFDAELYEKFRVYQYIPVFTGMSFEVLETGTGADPDLQRKKFAEHRELYTDRPQRFNTNGSAPLDNQPDSARLLQPGISRETATNNYDQSEDSISGVSNLSSGQETSNLPPNRERIVNIARSYIGQARPEFRSEEVRGGKLACAKVASSILCDAGVLSTIHLGVDAAQKDLLSKGWTITSAGQEKPGDVVIWAPVRSRTIMTSSGPQVVAGHKHIGIVTAHNRAVNNSSSRRMPVESHIYTGRGIEAILTPPAQIAGTRQIIGESGRRMEIDNNLNRRIKLKLAPYLSTIETAARTYGIPKNLLIAVIWQESGGNPLIASGVGAGGLMQLMPATARGFGLTEIYPFIRRTNGRYEIDPRDSRANPEKNINAGAKLLSQLLGKYNGNMELALAGYNWGAGNVDKYLGGKRNMPAETQGYTTKIPRLFRSLNGDEQAAA